jgi:hypothetical protein
VPAPSGRSAAPTAASTPRTATAFESSPPDDSSASTTTTSTGKIARNTNGAPLVRPSAGAAITSGQKKVASPATEAIASTTAGRMPIRIVGRQAGVRVSILPCVT